MSDELIDISGLDKATLLAALYNNSQPMGMGWMQARSDLTVEEAQQVLDERGDDVTAMFGHVSGRGGRKDSIYFDYLFGRPLKAEIGGDTFDSWGYDRDNGEGSAARIVAGLR